MSTHGYESSGRSASELPAPPGGVGAGMSAHHPPDLAAVLAPDDPEPMRELFAALAAKGIRCLYVPEGVEAEHGARLLQAGWGDDERTIRLYVIEDSP